MSLPFLFFAIDVNSCAICWWCPHLFGSLSVLQIKSGHTCFTKYKKLSWHNFICCSQVFSSLKRRSSVVNKSVVFGIIHFCRVPFSWVPICLRLHYIYLACKFSLLFNNYIFFCAKKNTKSKPFWVSIWCLYYREIISLKADAVFLILKIVLYASRKNVLRVWHNLKRGAIFHAPRLIIYLTFLIAYSTLLDDPLIIYLLYRSMLSALKDFTSNLLVSISLRVAE